MPPSSATHRLTAHISHTRRVAAHVEYAVDCCTVHIRDECLSRTWHRYRAFARLHSDLTAACGELSRALPALPPKGGLGGLHTRVVAERRHKLAVYLQELLRIACRQFGEVAIAEAVISRLDHFLGLTRLHEFGLRVAHVPADRPTAAVGGLGRHPSVAWTHARSVSAAAECIQCAWRACLMRHSQARETRSSRMAAARLYSARLEQTPASAVTARVQLLAARAGCFAAAAQWECAHRDCNAVLEQAPFHLHCKALRLRAESAIWAEIASGVYRRSHGAARRSCPTAARDAPAVAAGRPLDAGRGEVKTTPLLGSDLGSCDDDMVSPAIQLFAFEWQGEDGGDGGGDLLEADSSGDNSWVSTEEDCSQLGLPVPPPPPLLPLPSSAAAEELHHRGRPPPPLSPPSSLPNGATALRTTSAISAVFGSPASPTLSDGGVGMAAQLAPKPSCAPSPTAAPSLGRGAYHVPTRLATAGSMAATAPGRLERERQPWASCDADETGAAAAAAAGRGRSQLTLLVRATERAGARWPLGAGGRAAQEVARVAEPVQETPPPPRMHAMHAAAHRHHLLPVLPSPAPLPACASLRLPVAASFCRAVEEWFMVFVVGAARHLGPRSGR